MNTKLMPKFSLLLIFLFSLACSKTEENVPLTASVDLINPNEFVRRASLVNQNIPFKIVTESGEDVTDIATFYVNGESVLGSSFSSPTVGDFEVYGTYIQNGFEVTTETKPFSVIVPKRKIVVEDYTGTWCGFCPRVAAAIHDLEEETEDIAVVAIHETAGSFPDPMHFDQIQLLKDAYDVEGFPSARINRSVNWQTPHPTTDVTSIAGVDTNMAIAINSKLTGSELKVQLNVVYEEGSALGDKLVVYLLEDDIVYGQVNYYNEDPTSPYYNMGDIIPEFVHHDVLRESLTGVLGNTIPSTAALTEYIASFSFNIPSDYVADNLSIVAMVVDENNTAKNAQVAPINEDKPYQ